MGNGLPKERTQKHIEIQCNDCFHVTVASMQGWRPFQEDAHCIVLPDTDTGTAVFGVFDGHGGDDCSMYVKECTEEILHELKDPFDEASITDWVLSVDEEYHEENIDEEFDCGTTLVLATIRQRNEQEFEVLITNVGDSRAYLLLPDTAGDEDLEFISLSDDHVPSNPKEQQRIEACGGTVEKKRVDGLLAMSRAIGDWSFKVPQQKVIAVPEFQRVICPVGSYIFLCCDGIFEATPVDEVQDHLRDELFFNRKTHDSCSWELDAVQTLRDLLKNSLGNGSLDNMTAMLVQLTGAQDVSPSERTQGVAYKDVEPRPRIKRGRGRERGRGGDRKPRSYRSGYSVSPSTSDTESAATSTRNSTTDTPSARGGKSSLFGQWLHSAKEGYSEYEYEDEEDEGDEGDYTDSEYDNDDGGEVDGANDDDDDSSKHVDQPEQKEQAEQSGLEKSEKKKKTVLLW